MKPLPTGGGEALYARREKVYPREIEGRFTRLRTTAAWLLMGLFYTVAWLRPGGEPLLLFDLPARKFHIFGLTFWPQDFLLLTLTLIIAALSLFFFTALAGRLWCGYACPQTVWTEVFLAMERLIEGRRLNRLKLDQGPHDLSWWGRKSAKQALWIAFSLWTGLTFVGYFTPIGELAGKVKTFSTGPWETFWILFYGLATYGNAGFLREQVCKYMCPYARFQSAMFDRDTLIIAYDEGRGEPRGRRRRGLEPRAAGLGDCIDCTWCVQVCPTGIDIRDGLQIECIACGACIDACNQIMDQMNYPRGLIRYTTENAVLGRPTRLVRPRLLIYLALLAALVVAFGLLLGGRAPLIADVIRDRNALYRLAGEDVENTYTIRLINKTAHAQQVAIGVREHGFEVRTWPRIEIAAGAVQPVPVAVRAERDAVSERQTIHFVVTPEDAALQPLIEPSRFFAPPGERDHDGDGDDHGD